MAADLEELSPLLETLRNTKDPCINIKIALKHIDSCHFALHKQKILYLLRVSLTTPSASIVATCILLAPY